MVYSLIYHGSQPISIQGFNHPVYILQQICFIISRDGARYPRRVDNIFCLTHCWKDLMQMLIHYALLNVDSLCVGLSICLYGLIPFSIWCNYTFSLGGGQLMQNKDGRLIHVLFLPLHSLLLHCCITRYCTCRAHHLKHCVTKPTIGN